MEQRCTMPHRTSSSLFEALAHIQHLVGEFAAGVQQGECAEHGRPIDPMWLPDPTKLRVIFCTLPIRAWCEGSCVTDSADVLVQAFGSCMDSLGVQWSGACTAHRLQTASIYPQTCGCGSPLGLQGFYGSEFIVCYGACPTCAFDSVALLA